MMLSNGKVAKMPDKKLTDSEIVKAKAHFEYGIKCDIFQEPVLSYAKTVLKAFDEINRLKEEKDTMQHYIDYLKAENERLKAKCENTQIGYNFAEDEIKHLKKDKYKLQKALNQSEDYRVIVKAEAYKECIEKVKENFTEEFCGQKYDLIHSWFDNVLKELVGEDNV